MNCSILEPSVCMYSCSKNLPVFPQLFVQILLILREGHIVMGSYCHGSYLGCHTSIFFSQHGTFVIMFE